MQPYKNLSQLLAQSLLLVTLLLSLGCATIMDKNDKVVSNPGGTAPEYKDGELQLMVQSQPIFMHCHDVCIDEDKNIYVCQWNANKTYPIKLERV